MECGEARHGKEEDFKHQQEKLTEGGRFWRDNLGENHVQVQNGRPVAGSLRRKRHMSSTRDHRIPTGTETDAAIFGCRMALVKETVKVASGMATRAAASRLPENVGRGRAAVRRWMWSAGCQRPLLHCTKRQRVKCAWTLRDHAEDDDPIPYLRLAEYIAGNHGPEARTVEATADARGSH